MARLRAKYRKDEKGREVLQTYLAEFYARRRAIAISLPGSLFQVVEGRPFFGENGLDVGVRQGGSDPDNTWINQKGWPSTP